MPSPSPRSAASPPVPIPGGRPPARCPGLAAGLAARLAVGLAVGLGLMPGCKSAERHAAEADAQVYGILGKAARAVTGTEKTVRIERPVDNLRARLLAADQEIRLGLNDALDVAAENSRQFQQQKENLYRTALALTTEQHDFAVRFGGGGSAAIGGVADDSAQASFSTDLAASVNTESGGRLVANFATSFLRSVISGGGFDGSSLLSLTFTHPLLAGYGRHIVRENLTQAERDVVYAIRDFEAFRSDLTLSVVQDYYDVLSQQANLESIRANHQSLIRDRIRLDALLAANRGRAEDLAQARQREFVAENSFVNAVARLEGSLDRFKITLGLPTRSRVLLDQEEFRRLGTVLPVSDKLFEDRLIGYALEHRLDHQTAVDVVGDAARRIDVAEDALRSRLDFASAIDVPSLDGNRPFQLDWNRVEWSAGFDLDLALDRLPQRNVYRSTLIAFDAAVRAREQLEDLIAADIRATVRNLASLEKSFLIQSEAVALAELRVARTEMFFVAQGRFNTTTRDILEAKDDLLAAQLALTGATVDFAVAKLQLLRDLEALPLEPRGLRYDPGLPLPAATLAPPSGTESGPPGTNR